MPLNKYAPQAATHRRTESAILESTKELIANLGISKMSMIEIADNSQVSRATLYNHYRDKDSVLAALCDFEIRSLIALGKSAGSTAQVLEVLALRISADPALSKLRHVDSELLVHALAEVDHPLFRQFHDALAIILNSQILADVAMSWLIGQVLQPLNAKDCQLQAEYLVARANL